MTPTGEDLDERDVRALTECMAVLSADGDGLFTVIGENGNGEYLVDARFGSCECCDARHRDPEGGCKHARRVAFATGETVIPAWVDRDAVDPLVGEHVEGGPRFEVATVGETVAETPAVATDGGQEVTVADE